MAETLDVEIINSVLTIAEREYADRAKYFEGILALNPGRTGGHIAEYEHSAKRNRAHESQCRLLASQLPALLSSRSDAERLQSEADADDYLCQDLENRAAETVMKALLRERGDTLSMDAVHAIQRLRAMRDYYRTTLRSERDARRNAEAATAANRPSEEDDR